MKTYQAVKLTSKKTYEGKTNGIVVINTKIEKIVRDEDGNIKYYGRLAIAESAAFVYNQKEAGIN